MATVFYDGNGNEVTVSGGNSSGGNYGGYMPYSFYEAIGDSLTFNSWPGGVAKALQITNVVNHAVNGAHIIGTTSGGMIEQANAVSETCELCTIMGGTNDGAAIRAGNIGEIGTKDTTTYLGSYQTIIETLLAKNPKMRIFMLKPPRCYDRDDMSQFETISDCIDQLHEYYGIPVIDVYNDLGMNEFNYSAYLNDDKLHFNSDGVSALVTLVAHSIASI